MALGWAMTLLRCRAVLLGRALLRGRAVLLGRALLRCRAVLLGRALLRGQSVLLGRALVRLAGLIARQRLPLWWQSGCVAPGENGVLVLGR